MLNSRRWLPVLTLVTGVVIGMGFVGLRTGSSLAFVVPPLEPPAPKQAEAASAVGAQRGQGSRAGQTARYPFGNGGGSRREDSLGCHPDEDVSCTIVRETNGGLVVFTRAYRDGSQVAVVPATGAPAVEFGGSGICVVPGRSVRPLTATSRYPNGAPILE